MLFKTSNLRNELIVFIPLDLEILHKLLAGSILIYFLKTHII